VNSLSRRISLQSKETKIFSPIHLQTRYNTGIQVRAQRCFVRATKEQQSVMHSAT